MFLVSWLNATNSPRHKREIRYDDDHHHDYDHDLHHLLLFHVFPVFAGLLFVIYIMLLQWSSKYTVYNSIILFWALLLCDTVKDEVIDMSEWLLLTVCLTVTIVLIVIFRKKISIACEVLKEVAK